MEGSSVSSANIANNTADKPSSLAINYTKVSTNKNASTNSNAFTNNVASTNLVANNDKPNSTDNDRTVSTAINSEGLANSTATKRSKKTTKNPTPKTPVKHEIPCDVEYKDDLENVGKPFGDDIEVLKELNAATNVILDEGKRHKNKSKSTLRLRIYAINKTMPLLGVDAIVSAANERCLSGVGIDGIICDCTGIDPKEKC